jgi:hypothetical protein
MRERRYKYTVWERPLRQAQGPGVLSIRSVKGSTRMELRIREVDFKAGAKSKGSNGGVAVGRFPIATPLSLNKLISINDKKKWWRLERQTHPAQWVRKSCLQSPWTAFHGAFLVSCNPAAINSQRHRRCWIVRRCRTRTTDPKLGS